jgi:hypothetical protein
VSGVPRWLLLAWVVGCGVPVAGLAQDTTDVRLRWEGEHVVVAVTAAEARREHPLGPGSDRLQASGWSLEGRAGRPTLAKGLVQFTRPTRGYRLRVPSDTVWLDRVYGAHVAIGGCAVAVRPNAFVDGDAMLSVRVDRGRGEQVVMPGGVVDAAVAAPTPASRNAYWFIARPECVHPGREAVWIYDAGAVPASMLALLEASLPEALRQFNERLGRPALARPTVAVSYEASEGPVSWRGDVDHAGAIVLRMKGKPDLAAGGELGKLIEAFVLHEAFHLWNGVAYPQAPGSARAWLTEGVAEYATRKVLRDLGRMSDQDFLASMGQGLNRCVEALERTSGGIDALDGRGGSAVYDCGVVVQWLGDHVMARDGGGFFPAWRKIFADAASGDGQHDRSDYFRAVDPAFAGESPADPLMAWLVRGEGEFDAGAIADALAALGIRASRIDPPQVNPNAVRRVMMHLLAMDCRKGPWGYTTEPDHLRLDTGDRCTALAGDPAVSAVNGLQIGVRDLDLHASVRASCNAGAVVTLSRGAATRPLRCVKPLPALPDTLRVERDRFSVPPAAQ